MQPRHSHEKSRSRENSREPQQYGSYYQQSSFDQRNVEQKKKVHISNLPLHITEEDIKTEIESLNFGNVEDIKIIKKNSSGQQLNNTYYAFVQMSNQEEAENLLSNFEKYSSQNWMVKTSKEKQNKGDFIKRDSNQFVHGHGQFPHQNQQSFNFQQRFQTPINQQQQQQQFQNPKFHNNNRNQNMQNIQKPIPNQQIQQQQLPQPQPQQQTNPQNQFFVPQQFQQQQQQIRPNIPPQQAIHTSPILQPQLQPQPNFNIPDQQQQPIAIAPQNAEEVQQQAPQQQQFLPKRNQFQNRPPYHQQQQQQQQYGQQMGHQRFQPNYQQQQSQYMGQGKYQEHGKHYPNYNRHQFNENQNEDIASQLLNMPYEELEEYTKNMHNPLSNQILVRELWIGNIPRNITQKQLETNLKSFGELESVDFFDKGPVPFAFAKYRRVADASKAFEQQGTLQALLECSTLKISFSDHQRRINIVGDSYGYEKPEDLSSTIYIGYNTGSIIHSENELREEFSKYVKVKDINIRQANQSSQLRSYVQVTVEDQLLIKKEAAKKLYKKYMRDHHGDRRARIGDRKCEFQIQTKPKQRPQRMKMMPQNNEFQQQQQQSQSMHMDQFMPNQGQRMQQKEQMGFQGQQEQRKFPNQFQNQGFTGQPQQGMPKQFPNQQSAPYMQQKKFGQPGVMGQPNEQQGKLFSQLDYLTQFLVSESGNLQNQQQLLQQQEPMIPQVQEAQENLFEMDNAFWSGFITKSKKNRVGVDAHLIYGKDITLTDYNLNINFRTTFQEVLKHKVIAVCLFMPSNSTQTQLFFEYKKYFQEKNRAGVAQMQKYMLYIIPTGVAEIEEVINVGEDGMLGVFTEVEIAKENPSGETLTDIGKNLRDKNKSMQVQQPVYQQNYPYQQNMEQLQQQQEPENAELLEQELNDVLPMLDNPELLNILKSNMF